MSMDYKEFSEHADVKKTLAMVVCKDKWTKSIAAHMVEAKGTTEVAKKIVEFIDSFACFGFRG